MALFEVCLEGVDSAIAAERGGAGRVELCAALIEGGITPSRGVIAACRAAIDIDLMVMIRPRSGDFYYTERELDVMVADIEDCKSIGVTGVVFGCLTPAGDVARTQVQTLRRAAGDLSVTFHRAFDVCREPHRSLEELIELGVDRVLTSGQAATVPEGLPLLTELVNQAGDRIGILPGCGITPENVAEVLRVTGRPGVSRHGLVQTRKPHAVPQRSGVHGYPRAGGVRAVGNGRGGGRGVPGSGVARLNLVHAAVAASAAPCIVCAASAAPLRSLRVSYTTIEPSSYPPAHSPSDPPPNPARARALPARRSPAGRDSPSACAP